ncbi:MAG: tetratricopeptide repeat protein [Roseburia sp.]
MECYNCGAKLGHGDVCGNCGENVKLYKKILHASNAYYNDALRKVGVRDLSGAIENLRASLRLNKLNRDARNLLGLIYFEMGEVVSALTEWVISKNYHPNDNIASGYLDEIQSNPKRLEIINQTIKKYNQALVYCRQDSRDLAIIQLKKVLSLNPKMVAGHQLMGLLYIQERKYDLAKKALRNAGKIDANNTVTLRYLKEANAGLRENSRNKKPKKEELVSYQSGNDTIIQPGYLKDNSAIITIVNMVVGIVIGVAIAGFLLVPGVKRQVQNEAKAEVLDANNTITAKNQTISTLEAQIDDLTNQMTQARENEELQATSVSSYEQLLVAYIAYLDGDIETAGTALGNVNPDFLRETAKTTYDTINSEVNAEYISALYRDGRNAYGAQEFETAIQNLQKVVEMDETYQNGDALYYLAQSYRKRDDLKSAKIYYQKIAELYPGTERAAISQNYLDIEE